jgi:ArsR family transcriptional regulator
LSPRQAAGVAGAIDGLLDPGVFKALSDPTRLRLLACIAKCGRECGVGEVAECCSVDLSVVSRHLSALERAGVLEASRRGRTVSYRVRFAELAHMLRSLAAAIEECCPAEGCGGCGCEGGGCGPAKRSR